MLENTNEQINLLENIGNENVENAKKKRKTVKVLGYSIYKLIVYFAIYSFFGYVVETIYGLVSKGTLESRQSFLYGPFCGIYGLGAVVLILFLQFFNKNNNRLFIGGFIIGSIVEYLVSLFAENVLHVKWWDYSDRPLNINGRVCAYFSIFWGFLAIYFMGYVNPKVDKLINFIKSKFSFKLLKGLTIVIAIFFVFECVVTVYAIEMFSIRKVHEYDLDVKNKEYIEAQYDKVYGNKRHSEFINKFFDDEKIIKTFPNLKMQKKDGSIVYFDTIVGDIKPYYYKFKDK